jgi:signal transduction histidine kinase
MMPEVQRVDAGALVERLLPLLRHTSRHHDVGFESAFPPELPAMWADPNQLQQLLINLVVNAVEAVPPGGRVLASGLAASRDGRPGVVLTVRDTGHGVPPAMLPKIFDPFVTTKPPGRGTGLGLTICRDIVKAHGGSIRIDSTEGEGTTVTVWWPAAEDSAA